MNSSYGRFEWRNGLSQRTRCECAVARQDHAVLFKRNANDLVVIQRPVVEDIETQETHALRQPAQHDIGDEFHIIHHEGAKTRSKNRSEDNPLKLSAPKALRC